VHRAFRPRDFKFLSKIIALFDETMKNSKVFDYSIIIF